MSPREQTPSGLPADTVLRHRWEVPMLLICLSITALVFTAAVATLLLGWGDGASADEDIRDILRFIAALPFLAFVIFVMRYYMAAGVRANSVRAGPDQFAELYALYVSLAQRLEIARLPELYVVNGNGVVNAYAFSCDHRRRYVVIHAEIARLLADDPAVVGFVLAHELGHHKLGHVRWWRLVINILPNLLVLPGKAMVRAQEYSADRAAAAVCTHCAKSIGLLAVGPYLQHEVREQAFEAQAIDIDRNFFVRLANWVVDHSVNTKRYLALKNIERHGFVRHGSMFL